MICTACCHSLIVPVLYLLRSAIDIIHGATVPYAEYSLKGLSIGLSIERSCVVWLTVAEHNSSQVSERGVPLGRGQGTLAGLLHLHARPTHAQTHTSTNTYTPTHPPTLSEAQGVPASRFSAWLTALEYVSAWLATGEVRDEVHSVTAAAHPPGHNSLTG